MSKTHKKEISQEWICDVAIAASAFYRWLESNPGDVSKDDFDKFLAAYRIDPKDLRDLNAL